jgi:PHD/YefM family antitoxin component YafN of YafNO toxin-antitoxin module
MAVSATQLRQNIYAILDEALATGKPVDIERKGKILRIVPEPVEEEMSDEEFAREFPKLAALQASLPKDWFVGTDDLANMDWSEDFTELIERKPKKRT